MVQVLRVDYQSSLSLADDPVEISGIRKCSGRAPLPSQPWYRLQHWQIDTINGAHSSAIIYSIAETAKASNLKSYDYFVHLLEEIPKHMDDTDRPFLDDLLPWSPNLPDGIRKN